MVELEIYKSKEKEGECTMLPELKKPEVKLFTYTRQPLKAIALAIDIWHNPIPSDIADMNYNEEELIEKFRWLLKQPHQTPLEYFSIVWVIKNCSRAFQQQLTRHRSAAYSIQSLRVVDPGNFADEGAYHIPETIKDRESFHIRMKMIQSAYRNMIIEREKTEDARGILPLNIHSPITMCINYRVLMGLLKQRMCIAVQSEWTSVVQQIREELAKVHPIFTEPLDCLCQRHKKGESFCKTLHIAVTDKD